MANPPTPQLVLDSNKSPKLAIVRGEIGSRPLESAAPSSSACGGTRPLGPRPQSHVRRFTGPSETRLRYAGTLVRKRGGSLAWTDR